MIFCTCLFSGRITSQLQNWAFFTSLHGEPRNTFIYSMQKCQNVGNTSIHQKVVVSLLKLSCYSHFSCLKNFKRSFWKIRTIAVVTLFFWKSDVLRVVTPICTLEWIRWVLYVFGVCIMINWKETLTFDRVFRSSVPFLTIEYNSRAEIHCPLCAVYEKENVMNLRNIQQWQSMFREGKTNIKVDWAWC